jgi:biotin operon repressor
MTTTCHNDDASIILMLEHGWVSKEQLRSTLGLSERAVRDYLAGLNERLAPYGKCILSTAARKGYKIPNSHDEEDLRIVAAAIDELKSKAVSIFARRKVLEDFLKSAQTEKSEEGKVQLSLF